MTLQVKIPRYEDHLDAQSNTITFYIIQVSFSKQLYEVARRYSEFAELYSQLSQMFEEVSLFCFPGKSIFYSQSPHMKEFRRSVFEDFLRMVLSYRPVPEEVQDFLNCDIVDSSNTDGEEVEQVSDPAISVSQVVSRSEETTLSVSDPALVGIECPIPLSIAFSILCDPTRQVDPAGLRLIVEDLRITEAGDLQHISMEHIDVVRALLKPIPGRIFSDCLLPSKPDEMQRPLCRSISSSCCSAAYAMLTTSSMQLNPDEEVVTLSHMAIAEALDIRGCSDDDLRSLAALLKPIHAKHFINLFGLSDS